jgi:hypothetical protein
MGRPLEKRWDQAGQKGAFIVIVSVKRDREIRTTTNTNTNTNPSEAISATK